MNELIAKRYAQALFELARDAHDIAGWGDDLDVAVDACMNPTTLLEVEHPLVHMPARVRFLQEHTSSLRQEIQNLIRLLAERNRLRALPAIRDAYVQRIDDAEGVVRALVTVPVKLDAAGERQLLSRLKERFGEKVIPTVNVDPTIIGGAIIKFGDHIIDGSVITRLEILRQRLLTRAS